jgi:hypothetical protein
VRQPQPGFLRLLAQLEDDADVVHPLQHLVLVVVVAEGRLDLLLDERPHPIADLFVLRGESEVDGHGSSGDNLDATSRRPDVFGRVPDHFRRVPDYRSLVGADLCKSPAAHP